MDTVAYPVIPPRRQRRRGGSSPRMAYRAPRSRDLFASFRSLIVALAMVLLLSTTLPSVADAKQLIVLVQPVTSVAGEPLSLQPAVAITDDDGNILTDISEGTVRAQIGTTPSRYAIVLPTTNVATFVNGVAKFTDLYLNPAGVGYTIKLVSIYHGVRTETASFDIVVGDPYELMILTDISTAYGGTPFRPQPSVGVVDRGGNVVTGLTAGTVTLSILSNPAGGNLLPVRALTTSVSRGTAKFQGLYIDVAGSPYYLQYRTDLALPGGTFVDTNPFTVAAGVCNTLVLLTRPTESTGGKALGIQPVLKLIDAGGNTLEEDSSSFIKVSIASNPSDGALTPSESLRANVRKGFAIFRSLRIDKAGNDYSLLFTLYTKASDREVWSKTTIEKLSEPFNVIVGRPVSLFLRQSLSDGVLDGQPNELQPQLELLDSGGNIVSSIVTGSVVASMVPSAAIFSSIIVDTTGAPEVTVLEVRALATPGYVAPYGVGMLLSIQVTFSDEVIASGVPTLTLASSTTGGANGIAECTTVNLWSKTLTFQYYVAATDTTTDLDYASTASLSLSGGGIVDRNGRMPSLTLPTPGSTLSLSGTSAVLIDVTPPEIVSVSSLTPGDGEYGAGEEIYLRVLYSLPVSVYGNPVLPVELAAIGNGALRRDATFTGGNNTNTLVFIYMVQNGDSTAGMALDVVSSIVLPTGSYVKRFSTRPTTDATATMAIAPVNLGTLNTITIDTAIPTVDAAVGVTGVSSDGVYTPGDSIEIAVTFTKPVQVDGFPRLYMETGPVKRPAGYISGSGTKTLVFAYTVAAYDLHTGSGNNFLNYRDDTALDLNGGSINRLIQRGTDSAVADISLAASTLNLKSLRDNARILLDAVAATVVAISIVTPAPGTTLMREDEVTISISFSSRVSVDTTGGTPSLALAVGDSNRQATYLSGSGSLALLFYYKVKLGDKAALGLDYRDTASLKLNGGRIQKTSAAPIMDADLKLPAPSLALANPVVLVNQTLGFLTTIERFTVDLPVGEYGSNQVISFSITFTDEVVVDGQPALKLNTGKSVLYIAGAATPTLLFMHITTDGEATLNLDKLDDASLVCDPPACSIMNFNGELVDLSLANIALTPAGIVINTDPPQVVDVYAITPAATINGGSFVVGDVIDILVEMDFDVFIDPPTSAYPEKAPLLILNTKPSGRHVLCIGFYQDNHKLLHFQYTVEEGDVQDDLTYVDEDSLTLNNGQCAIKRFSTTPTTDALLTLPEPTPLGTTRSLGVLNVNTTKVPTILSVSSSTQDGSYRCGDVIELIVTFSQHVVVDGTPLLWLDLGAYTRKALYVRGSGTTTLSFVYVVQENDYTVDLEYIDHHSLDASGIGNGIYHASTNPTTAANLDLPYPFTQNSLSFNKNLMVNGRKPTITSAKFISPDSVYGYNDKLLLELTFDACVFVVAAPVTGNLPQVKFQPSPVGASATITRYGVYVGGSPGVKLRFEYTVKTGDTSKDLDYADALSVVLNGAKILTCTTDVTIVPPVQPVETHLNPPGGSLLGGTSKQITFGKVAFTDLLVNRLGFDYEVLYQTTIGGATLVAVNHFDVLYSATFGLRSSPYASGDSLGGSVDVDGDTLVMGAPHAKEPISAVQVVTVVGDATSYVDEIQVITTKATQRPAVQEITSTAAVGESLGGWFFLKMGSIGPTRRLYYNFDETQLRVAIELDLGFGQNSVKVTRTENTFCACSNAYVWSITFMYVEGPLPALTTSHALTGLQATVGDGRGAMQARIVVDSTAIGGFFTLQTNGLVTRNIKYNTAESDLSAILTQDLKLPVARVMRSQPTAVRGYSWSVTFTASDQLYDVAELTSQSVGLTGYEAKCTVRTVRDGLGRLSGTFRLRFRNDLFPNDETEDLSVTASDLAVETALEKLVSIQDVRVTRSTAMNVNGGYSWTVTFLQVNTKNDFGPVLDSSGNLPALVPVTTATLNGKPNTPILKGTSARVEIQLGGYSLPPVASDKTHWGLPGDDAGMVSVFIRAENDWKQQGSTLTGLDTRAGDQFGTSVSLKRDQLIVGAPFAAVFGDYEVQNLLCDADGGFFKLIYRGKRTDAIPFNADKSQVHAAVVNVMSVQFSDVDVTTSFTSVCSAGNTQEISIVLRNGDHGDREGNVLNLQVDGAALTKQNGLAKGSIQVREYSAGTFRSDGENAKGLQVGACYLFTRDSTAQGTLLWSQQAKLTPPSAQLFDIREYGKTVGVYTTYAVVGAPGSYLDEGRVFVYQYNAGSSTWALFQILSAAPYSIAQGDRFGEAVAISGNPLGTITVVVGAPGYSDSNGAVFVFDLLNGKFQNRQFLLQITPELQAGDRFGASLDVDMATSYTLVIGAPRNAYKSGKDSGAALVLTRRSAVDTFFTLQQVLFGSDTRTGDHFGTSVAVDKDTVLIGAHEERNGARTIRKAVQSVSIDAPASSSSSGGSNIQLSGGSFVLRLKRATTTSSLRNESVTEVLTTVSSRMIPFNLDAASLRVALESDFPFLGKLLVTRDGPKEATKGYTWYITFAGTNNDLPLLEIDGRKLLLSSAAGAMTVSPLVRPVTSVKWVVRVPPVLRSNSYLFTRNDNGKWTEQATLYPREKQYFSWFGSSVALDQRTAIVGAPNLDTYETGVNSGGGFVYDLGLFALGFTSKTYSVLEGNEIDVAVQRCSLKNGFCALDVAKNPRLFINFDTGDAFSDAQSKLNHVVTTPHIGPFQKLSQLEGIPRSSDAFFAPFVKGQEPFPQIPNGRWLVADHIGTAQARNQFYGSNTERRSLWIDSKFDYSGSSDYMTATGELYFDVGETLHTFKVQTTSDFVVEDPDETVPLRLSLPGIWPSYGGSLWATLTIRDNGDGGSGTRSYLDTLIASQSTKSQQSGSQFSGAVSVYSDGNVAIVGAPYESQVLATGVVQCGAAYVFVSRLGLWETQAKLTPVDCAPGMQFGGSVAIDGTLGTIRAIVGASGAMAAYVYRRDGTVSSPTWVAETKLSDPTGVVTSPTHAFGGLRGVGLSGDVAVVGAAGVERIFVYHRTLIGWEFITSLVCSDRVVHRILEQDVEQDYGFGSAIAIYRRTIAVGAPHADAGAFTPTEYHGKSFDRQYFGNGAAYLFHLQAQEQVIQLRTDDPLSAGSFQVTTSYRGITGTTGLLSYGATPQAMKAALEGLSAIKLVEVTRTGTIDQGFSWSVTFIGDVLSVPILTAQWKGYGCVDCDAFSSLFKADPANQMVVSEVTPIGTWLEQARLTAPDSNPGDRFGGSIALSGEQLVIGAEGSGALTTTTWDFETGDLTGWLTTGTAFDSQPTYGDNSYARLNMYRFRVGLNPGYGQRSHNSGRYWVGTFENRKGAGKITAEISSCAFASDALCKAPNYNLPGSDPAGATQGDDPQGTMTSQAFTILGPWLSFKIGGGCDIRLIYVELLVEGMSVLKETGKCVETMETVKWDLSNFQNRTAQLRVVDRSSSDFWGHINFDDVQFSWPIEQATTPRAGVAYAFRRKAPASRDPCIAINRRLCDWEFQARLIASDKHGDDRFGFDVAVDDTTGIAVVSAPGQHAVDANNTILLDDKSLQSLPGVGSVYVFKRAEEVRDGKGVLLSPPKWAPKETAKLQFPKKQPNVQFGASVALDKSTLVVGAPFFTSALLKPRAGQAFVYDAGFANVQFTATEFSCVEGNAAGIVSLTIQRAATASDLSLPLTIGYATEDLNAKAIDALKYVACMNVPVTQRGDCWDYQQTAGEVTFAAGETSKQIVVPIVDDTCYEAKLEYFVVRLNVPGGEALIGEQYIATVRIDDDDWAYEGVPC